MPAASGWRSSIVPLPSRVVTTGACRCSATAVSAARGVAEDDATTGPDQRTLGGGESGGGAGDLLGVGGLAHVVGRVEQRDRRPPRRTPPAASRSRPAGAGRLHAANASWTASGISPAVSARSRHVVIGRTRSSWSWISCRSPRPWPMPSRLTCPAISTTGDEAANAVARPRAGVVDADPGHHERDTRAAAAAGIAVGDIGGALLVPGGDEPDRRLVVEGVERVHGLVAGEAEHPARLRARAGGRGPGPRSSSRPSSIDFLRVRTVRAPAENVYVIQKLRPGQDRDHCAGRGGGRGRSDSRRRPITRREIRHPSVVRTATSS